MHHTPLSHERLLTELDFTRLNKLRGGQLPPELADSLSSADLLPSRDIPPDVVTMNSRLRLQGEADPEPRQITLCYPEDANAEAGLVSLLSPMGASVLGHRVGGEAEWLTPTGAPRTARILALDFQPEAAGQYTT